MKHCPNCPYFDAQHLSPKHRSLRQIPIRIEKNNSDTLLIFQSPGIDEWRNGKPISSNNKRSAAHKLLEAIKLIGGKRSDFDIANAVQCFPGKKTLNETSRDKTPSIKAKKACSNYLRENIVKNKYTKIVAFGKFAKESLQQLRLDPNITVLFAKHPSAPGVSNSQIATYISKP